MEIQKIIKYENDTGQGMIVFPNNVYGIKVILKGGRQYCKEYKSKIKRDGVFEELKEKLNKGE